MFILSTNENARRGLDRGPVCLGRKSTPYFLIGFDAICCTCGGCAKSKKSSLFIQSSVEKFLYFFTNSLSTYTTMAKQATQPKKGAKRTRARTPSNSSSSSSTFNAPVETDLDENSENEDEEDEDKEKDKEDENKDNSGDTSANEAAAAKLLVQQKRRAAKDAARVAKEAAEAKFLAEFGSSDEEEEEEEDEYVSNNADIQSLLEKPADADDLVDECIDLKHPSEHPQARNYDRIPLHDLKRGMVVPIILFKKNRVCWDNILDIVAEYVVALVCEDGKCMLKCILENKGTLTNKYITPNWLTFNSVSSKRTVLILSAEAIERGLLVPEARLNLSMTKLSPVSLSSASLVDDEETNDLESSDKSRNKELRKIYSAPLRRALQNDTAKISLLLGSEQDITTITFLTHLRNTQTSAALDDLPFLVVNKHLEAFLRFRWSKTPHVKAGVSESCHLNLFLPYDSRGNLGYFRHTEDICTALFNLEQACVILFLDSEVLPFYEMLFAQLQRQMRSNDVHLSINAVPIDYLVWRLSRILVD